MVRVFASHAEGLVFESSRDSRNSLKQVEIAPLLKGSATGVDDSGFRLPLGTMEVTILNGCPLS